MHLIKPKRAYIGDTIGVFTPSYPAYTINPELFDNGVKNLQELGFKVKLGFLTESRSSQGYRSGSPQDRAKEFMSLIEDPEVKILMSTIGGTNSSSMIPYLDFESIRKHQKIVCGYSDLTSLHLSILKYSKLKTLYGPALMTWFGEWPNGVEESTRSFLDSVTIHNNTERELLAFPRWSLHSRSWENGDWKNLPRLWSVNRGWKTLVEGTATANIVVANLNTLLSAAGTDYFPNLEGRILLIEDMASPWSREERSLRQLQLMGVFDQISGLILGKPEHPDPEGAPFDLDDLLLEIVGKRAYPIVSEFDWSHTIPMHSIAEETRVSLEASHGYNVTFKVLESFVE